MRYSLLGLLACIASATAQLQLQQGKLAIIDSVGIARDSLDFTSTTPNALPPTTLTSGDTLRLTFTVLNGDAPIQPQQAMILWQPEDITEQSTRGRDHMSVVKVRKGGKGKWELDLTRAPTSLLSLSHGPISATLLVGHANVSPLRLFLGSFTLPSSLVLPFPYPPSAELPKAWEVERYSKMPELHWTFKEGEKKLGIVKSALGLAVVLSPWIVLLGFISHLSPSLRSPSPTILAFLLSIIAFEGLIVAYWVGLKLIPTLPWFGALAVVTAWTGRRALGELRVRRVLLEKAAVGAKVE